MIAIALIYLSFGGGGDSPLSYVKNKVLHFMPQLAYEAKGFS